MLLTRDDTFADLSRPIFDRVDAWWRAANYLTAAQIYLKENPLLREPLRPEHIKPRLLGHWGTSPGLNFVYAHLNRLIREHDVNAIFLAGPGHGGPAVLANTYLEGTYSEVYPDITRDLPGLRRFVRQFSTPGGVPSHVSVPTPGSIHEGGELGYVLLHAFGAAFDNPDLFVTAVVGDGEAETGPLEGSWKGVRFLNPARDGAVLPILHLNGFKISSQTVLGSARRATIEDLLRGHGYDTHFVEGDDPAMMHREFASALDASYRGIRHIQARARAGRPAIGARWPAIVLRTPKGWTGPRIVDGLRVEGTFRAHQIPIPEVRENPAHLALLEEWLRSYAPDELFDVNGAPQPELTKLAPIGERRMSANLHANGGERLVELALPKVTTFAVDVPAPARVEHESTRQLGMYLRDTFIANEPHQNFRLFCPDETSSNRLDAVFEATERCMVTHRHEWGDHVSSTGRVMEVLSEHTCQGWLEGYLLTGRHGLFVTYEAFAMVSASMTVQHAKWLEQSLKLAWRAPVASLNILLTSTCWRNDHNGFSHQGPGLIDTVLSLRGSVTRIYLPPDANCLLATADHCFRSRNYVNLIVIDKQPQLQWLDIASAVAHCRRGISVWPWASSRSETNPDVVLAAAGDVPTLETVAAAWLLKRHVPELSLRVVNVVDLMRLAPPQEHPHGLQHEEFDALFTTEQPVIFAFHGYRRAVHQLLHGRTRPERFHVRGFMEEGTTTTPFDMVVRNEMSRYHLVLEALRRVQGRRPGMDGLERLCRDMLDRHQHWIREHLEDMPEVREWRWEP